MAEVYIKYLFLGLGIISLATAFLNWNWVLKKQQKAGFILILDRNGARVFNFMIGILMILIGVFDWVFPLVK